MMAPVILGMAGRLRAAAGCVAAAGMLAGSGDGVTCAGGSGRLPCALRKSVLAHQRLRWRDAAVVAGFAGLWPRLRCWRVHCWWTSAAGEVSVPLLGGLPAAGSHRGGDAGPGRAVQAAAACGGGQPFQFLS